MKKFLLILVLLVMFLPVTSRADDKKKSSTDDILNEQTNSLDTGKMQDFINQLNSDTSGYMPSFDFKSLVNTFKTGGLSFNFKDMLTGVVKFFLNDVLLNTKLLAELVILAVICAVLQNLENAFNNDSVSNLAYYACYLLLIIIVVKSFSLAVSIGRETIQKMVDFMLALLPTLMTLLASTGGVVSVSVLDPLIMFLVHFISNAVSNFTLPLIFLTAILTIVNNLSNTFQINKLAGLLKQVCVWTLGIMVTIFIGAFTVRSTAAKTIDQVTAKTLKYAVDNFIPIVGKCLSDAVSTVAGYTLILKDAVSTAGLIIFIMISVFPLLKIISMIFIYKIAGALIEPIADKRIVNCLNDVGNSLTLLFASVLCVAVLFFVMVTIMASTGKMAVSG